MKRCQQCPGIQPAAQPKRDRAVKTAADPADGFVQTVAQGVDRLLERPGFARHRRSRHSHSGAAVGEASDVPAALQQPYSVKPGPPGQWEADREYLRQRHSVPTSFATLATSTRPEI